MENITQLDIEESRETLEILYEMSQILNCSLSREALSVLIAMIEKGANPEALIQVVKEMRNENTVISNSTMTSNKSKSTK